MKRSILHISPSTLSGNLSIPPSKSHTMRAILFGSLGMGTTIIHNYLHSPDTESMIDAMRALGTSIKMEESTLTIIGLDGKLYPCQRVIDAGNSGQVFRFVSSLSALLPTYTIITGDHSIRTKRPILPLLSGLRQLGALATWAHFDGRAPIIIRGPLQAGYAKISGEDSQPVSGLLIASSFLHGTTQLEVTKPGEKPWIDMTLFWLKKLGAHVNHHQYENYTITGPLHYPGFTMYIPGDWSSATFPLVAALITCSTLQLKGIDLEEVQGDRKIVELLQKMGAQLSYNSFEKTLTVFKSDDLEGVEVDINEMIDALPIIAVLGCFAKGKTSLYNASVARNKESDRLMVITQELRKMGAQIDEQKDSLVITQAKLHGASLYSHQDHRIAMALSVAALGAKTPSCIEGVECIAKSYPNFAANFQNIGAQIKLCDI